MIIQHKISIFSQKVGFKPLPTLKNNLLFAFFTTEHKICLNFLKYEIDMPPSFLSLSSSLPPQKLTKDISRTRIVPISISTLPSFITHYRTDYIHTSTHSPFLSTPSLSLPLFHVPHLAKFAQRSPWTLSQLKIPVPPYPHTPPHLPLSPSPHSLSLSLSLPPSLSLSPFYATSSVSVSWETASGITSETASLAGPGPAETFTIAGLKSFSPKTKPFRNS